MTEKEDHNVLPAAGAAPRYKRRNYFVKQWMQTRFIIYYLVIFIGSSTVLGILIYRHAREAIRKEMFQGHSFAPSTWDMLRPDVVRITVAVSLFVILAGALATWLLSRKIGRSAGIVIDNIKTYRRGGNEQSWTPVRYPPEMKVFQTLLSDGLQAHRARMQGLRETAAVHAKGVRRGIESLRGAAAGSDERDAGVRELTEGTSEIRKSLDRFKLV